MPENKGYAYVRYRLDDTKTTVPLSFVLDWEPEKPVNTSKLYKVFWSNVEDDTPTSLAQRVSEEPHVIESKDDPKYGQAGYYRATIYCTAGTEETLDELKQKRQREVPIPLCTSSFDILHTKKTQKRKDEPGSQIVLSASEKKRAVRNGSNANVEDIYKKMLGGNDICVDDPASLSSPGDNGNDETAGNGPKTPKRKSEESSVEEPRPKREKEAHSSKDKKEKKMSKQEESNNPKEKVDGRKLESDEKKEEEKRKSMEKREDRKSKEKKEEKERKWKAKKEEEERKLKAKKEEEERKLKAKKEEERKVKAKKEEEERKLKAKKEDERKLKAKKEEERKMKAKKEEEERKLKAEKEEEERKLKAKKEEEERKLKANKEEEERKLKAKKEEEERKLKEAKEESMSSDSEHEGKENKSKEKVSSAESVSSSFETDDEKSENSEMEAYKSDKAEDYKSDKSEVDDGSSAERKGSNANKLKSGNRKRSPPSTSDSDDPSYVSPRKFKALQRELMLKTQQLRQAAKANERLRLQVNFEDSAEHSESPSTSKEARKNRYRVTSTQRAARRKARRAAKEPPLTKWVHVPENFRYEAEEFIISPEYKISKEDMAYLWNRPKGEIHDLEFLKETAVKLFTAAVLRKSVAKGIRRKGAKFTGLDKVAREGLRVLFILRAQREGVEVTRNTERTKDTVVTLAINEKAKTLRRAAADRERQQAASL